MLADNLPSHHGIILNEINQIGFNTENLFNNPGFGSADGILHDLTE